MKTIRALLLSVPLLAAACSSSSSGAPDDYAPLGPNQSALSVDVVGAGTVTYDQTTLPPCTSDGSAPQHCDSVKYDGVGSVTAKAATGWKFVGWSLTLGAASANTITSPENPTQNLVPGTTAALTATFVPLAHAITARFTQQTFSTQYFVEVENPDLDVIKVVWSGPNCGEWDPQTEQFGAEKTTTFSMTWKHPHPPCDETTEHKDVVVRATITIKDKSFVCEYKGADSGKGEVCKPVK